MKNVSQIFLVATATVFLSASINVMPTKFVSRLHRWKYLWSMCNATVGCKLCLVKSCGVRCVNWRILLTFSMFALQSLHLLSCCSLPLWESLRWQVTSVRIPTVTFSMDVLSPRPHGVPIHRWRPPATQNFCAVQNGWGSPASVTRVSVSMYRVQYPAVQEIKKVAKTSTHTHTVTQR